MSPAPSGISAEVRSVAIGRWASAAAPTRLKTLLGSCAGLVLHDRAARIGGLAHVVLPDSRGATDQPGKFADTAIPGLLLELDRLAGPGARGRLGAKVFGGASMFSSDSKLEIGRLNLEAVDRILAGLRIPILARDTGGNHGRHVILDTATGLVTVRAPGGDEYTI